MMTSTDRPRPPLSLRQPLRAVEALADGDPVIVDCRFRLDDTAAGEAAWRAGHIPGSRYAHLDRDLSDPVVPGRTGRHPLPSVASIRQRFAALGIDGDRPVVFLDDAGGPYAARAWWMACLAGHPQAQVLDGGWQAWLAAGGEPATDVTGAPAPAAPWPERPALVAAVDAAVLAAGGVPMLDARARPRFEGSVEPLDPVAGHIPGARCAPFGDNLAADGRFLPGAALRERWAPLLGPEPAAAICYCGSGVTAAHNVLAAVAGGLPAPRLYPGSWSEWVTDPARPVATGPETDPAP